jgi:hypothetical protein
MKLAALALGIGFLVFMIQAEGGVGPMLSALVRIGWWFPLAFLPTILAQWLRTFAWSLVFSSSASRPPMKALWRARLAGEALNYLTFAGPLLGDPVKASLLKSQTGCDKALVSVGVDRFLYAMASILFIALAGSMWLGGLAVVAVIACGALVAGSPRFALRFGQVITGKMALTIVGLHVASNLCMALEAGILLKGLGVEATVLQSSAVEALSKGLNGIFFFLPMQIGVAEGGNQLLFRAMNMGAAVGLALGLARRIRSMLWSLLGLALMA